MKKKTYLIIFLILAIAVFLFLYLGGGREASFLRKTENVPSTPANEICLKISHSDNVYYCLAAVNQDESYCQNLDKETSKI